ncbi:porin family protein [Pontibacter mangrovi]|uniref:PorT family protein n=1 Tax=Pontibacter mangrovi TaxID=2589816 RepID=A0A501W962_9BACT|nr:porin family protein [Pontibacter mangrovi]TPE45272.1 PorT family protein [Pontibacter mangrovi]
MKKLYFLFLALFLIQSMAEAQEKPRFGLKGGINVSDYTGRGYNDFSLEDTRTSYNMGLVSELPLAAKWNVQSELLYSEQGYVLNNNNSAADLEVDLNYLQLPLLAELKLWKGLYLQAGPQLSYLLNKDSLPEDGENGTVFNYNRVDFSIAFGAEYQFQNLMVFGRYSNGINRIVNSSDVQTHNRVMQLGLGILL